MNAFKGCIAPLCNGQKRKHAKEMLIINRTDVLKTRMIYSFDAILHNDIKTVKSCHGKNISQI